MAQTAQIWKQTTDTNDAHAQVSTHKYGTNGTHSTHDINGTNLDTNGTKKCRRRPIEMVQEGYPLFPRFEFFCALFPTGTESPELLLACRPGLDAIAILRRRMPPTIFSIKILREIRMGPAARPPPCPLGGNECTAPTRRGPKNATFEIATTLLPRAGQVFGMTSMSDIFMCLAPFARSKNTARRKPPCIGFLRYIELRPTLNVRR